MWEIHCTSQYRWIACVFLFGSLFLMSCIDDDSFGVTCVFEMKSRSSCPWGVDSGEWRPHCFEEWDRCEPYCEADGDCYFTDHNDCSGECCYDYSYRNVRVFDGTCDDFYASDDESLATLKPVMKDAS